MTISNSMFHDIPASGVLTSDQRARIDGYVDQFNADDEECYAQDVPDADAADWIKENTPTFACSDPLIEEVWHYRWWVFRKHIRSTPAGRVITEFLPAVYWAGPYNSINCADGHHLAEARWLRDGGALAREDARFWFAGPGDVFAYSTWTIDSVWRYAVIRDDHDFAISLLDDFIAFWERVETTHRTDYGLMWSDDDRDCMEMSISGPGLRPTLNSYMAANAHAIARIAHWAGREDLAEEFDVKARNLEDLIRTLLWDEKDRFFKVVPIARQDDPACLDFDDIDPAHNARELLGYIPWIFGIAGNEHSDAWRFLNDRDHFRGDVAPTTAERCHPRFRNNDNPHECQWNGPSWPFATTQLIDAMIESLQTGVEGVSRADLWRELRRYAAIHFRDDDKNGRINWLDEDLDPDTGEWISRTILENWGWRKDKGGYERGKDYNHSAFCDLVIRGLAGVRVEETDGGRISLVVEPLAAGQEGAPTWFELDHLPVAGREVTIRYDGAGTHFGQAGLTVKVNEEAHHATGPEPRISITW